MREIYAASSAAGVAVAFGAPIGGVIFSMEEMMSFGGNVGGGGVVGRGFLMALVACIVVRWVNPFWTGVLVMFEVHYEKDWHFFEVNPYPLSPSHRYDTPDNLRCISFCSGSNFVVDSIFCVIGNLWRNLWCDRN